MSWWEGEGCYWRESVFWLVLAHWGLEGGGGRGEGGWGLWREGGCLQMRERCLVVLNHVPEAPSPRSRGRWCSHCQQGCSRAPGAHSSECGVCQPPWDLGTVGPA